MVTQDLGDLCGLDYDTAYFMRYGKYPPPRERKKAIPPKVDWETIYEPDPYYCWQGTRIPQWFE